MADREESERESTFATKPPGDATIPPLPISPSEPVTHAGRDAGKTSAFDTRPIAQAPAVWAAPQFAEFEILDELGRGGMGVVYKARDLRRGHLVALKTLNGFDPELLYRFKREFRALAGIAHRNLVSLYELVGDGRRWCFTMELIEGCDFRTHVRPPTMQPGEPLSLEQLGKLRGGLRQLAEGLVALHDAGKLHRDIKPRNIMVSAEGRAVLLDFGLTAELGQSGWHQSTEQHMVGTAAYMSPEQAAGKPVSPATDWYSVGVLLYELLTGQLPFGGSAVAIFRAKQESEPPPPRTLAAEVPEDLDRLCTALLSRLPEARPDGRAVLRLLEPDSLKPTATAVSPLLGDLPFVGREAELQTLRDAYEFVRSGRSAVVEVSGLSGMGKSSLIRRFVETVQADAATVVLEGRCYEQESVPFKAIDSLIDSLARYLTRLPPAETRSLLPRHFSALARVFPVLGQLEDVLPAHPAGREAHDPQETRRRAFGALRELLGRLGERRPLMLVMDDLQWGDLDGARLWAEILTPPDEPLLLFIAAYRSEDLGNPFLQAFRANLEKLGQAVVRRTAGVGELSVDDSEALAARLIGHSDAAARDMARAIARESRGNTYFVHELARHATAGVRSVDDDSSSIALDAMLWRRVEQLPPTPRRLLEVVATAGRPIHPDTAAAAAGLAQADPGAWSVLRNGHFLRTVGAGESPEVATYHDRIRETVVARLNPEVRRRHHAALADALDRAGESDPERLALHLREAGRGDEAGRRYVEAADAACRALAFDQAARLYATAMELLRPTGDARHSLQIRLADAYANAGRGRQAAELYQAAAAEARDAEFVELQRRAFQEYLISGHVTEGLEVLRRVAADAGLYYPPTQRSARWRYVLNQLRLRWRGVALGDRRRAPPTSGELSTVDIYWSMTIGLGLVDPIRAAYFQAVHVRLALDSGDEFRALRALALEGAYASTGLFGGRRYGERIDAAIRTLAARTDDPYLTGIRLLMQGIREGLRGQWQTSRRSTEQAVEVLRERCKTVSWELATARRFLMWGFIYMGDLRQARSLAAETLADALARNDQFAVNNVREVALPFLCLADDKPEEQIAAAGTPEWPEREWHVGDVNRLIDAVQREMYDGRGEAAHQLLPRYWRQITSSSLFRVTQIRVFAWFARGRAALAAAQATGRADFLADARRAAKQLGRERDAWAAALSLPLAAGVSLQQGDTASAADTLRSAVARLELVDMRLHAAACRRRLGQLIGGEEGRALIAAADAWMTEQTIQNPERMTGLLAPGFGEDQPATSA